VEPTCHRPCRQASRAHWPSGAALPCCSTGGYNTPVSDAEAAAVLSERPRVTGKELAALPAAVSHGAAPPCRSYHATPAAIPPHRPERPSLRAHLACPSLSRAAVTPPNRAPRQSPLSRAATPLYPAVYPHRHQPHLELPLAPLEILRAARRHHTERCLRRRRAARAAPPYVGHRQSPPAGAGVTLSLPDTAVRRQ
jgi:hypothetical protein